MVTELEWHNFKALCGYAIFSFTTQSCQSIVGSQNINRNRTKWWRRYWTERQTKKKKKKIHTHTYIYIFGQRNLAGYSPWGCKESTRLSTHTHTHTYMCVCVCVCVYIYIYIYTYICVLSHFNHVWLCDPMNYSLPGSCVHGILQVRILQWVAMPPSKGSSWHRDQTWVPCGSCIAGKFFTTEPPGKLIYIYNSLNL